MKPKRVDPLTGLMDFLGTFESGDIYPSEQITDELENSITVDTCLATDTGIWETGIERKNLEGKWIIVEQYEDEESARIGHLKWVNLMKEMPDYPLKDIDMWSLDEF